MIIINTRIKLLTYTLILLSAILAVACTSGATLPVAVNSSPTPPGIPTAMIITATPEPSHTPTIIVETTIPSETPPTDYPTLTAQPTITPTRAPSSSGSGGGGVVQNNPAFIPGAPTALPDVPNGNTNLLANAGFEGAARMVGFDAVQIIEGWQPFYCAEPYTPGRCLATRNKDGNDSGLTYTIPEYTPTSDGGRVRQGGQAQSWGCVYRVCRGGVYQSFPTKAGDVCEVNVWVQSWSSVDDNLNSDLKTQDDRDNSTWYIRVDRGGGDYAWADRVIASKGFGYADGVYDNYTRINYSFVALGGQSTLFIENIRLWPVKNNASFVDEASVRCFTPSNPTTTISYPTSRGLRIGSFSSPTEVFGPNPDSSAWDSGSLGGGDIIRVGNEFWLYYSSNGDGVGLAKSSDGLNWVRAQNSPVFSPGSGGSWDFKSVIEPAVIYDESTGKFEMWYMSGMVGGTNYDIGFGYATSDDGVNWNRVGSKPVITYGTPGSWDEERIGGLDVVKIDQAYYLFYSATSLHPEWQRQIGCQISSDGINWQQCPENPVLSPDIVNFPFEGIETEQPQLVYENGLWLISYTGFGGPQGQNFLIGLGASFDGLHWEKLFKDPVINASSTMNPIIYLDTSSNLLWMWYTLPDQGDKMYAITAPITLP